MSAKAAGAKLESEVKQEKGNGQDLRKMLADERNVMSTMDMEHQLQLVELEQRHQEKVLITFTIVPIYLFFFFEMYTVHIYEILQLMIVLFLLYFCVCVGVYRSFTSLTNYRTNPYAVSQTKQSRKMKTVQKRRSFSSASKFRFVSIS